MLPLNTRDHEGNKAKEPYPKSFHFSKHRMPLIMDAWHLGIGLEKATEEG
jgi:hypothetical protein